MTVLKEIAKAAFPDYRGRRFTQDAFGSCRFSDLNWSGGSRSSYRCVRIADLAVDAGLGTAVPAPWANPFEGKTVVIPHGFAIVERRVFCGKEMGLTVYTAAMEALEGLSA